MKIEWVRTRCLLKMTFVGGSSERFFTNKSRRIEHMQGYHNWIPKRHCTFSKWIEVRAGAIPFHTPMPLTPKDGQNAANSDGVPILLLWMLPITPASKVCNEEEMTQTKPVMFHSWWISRFLVGSDASWVVGFQGNACERIGDDPGVLVLGGLRRIFRPRILRSVQVLWL